MRSLSTSLSTVASIVFRLKGNHARVRIGPKSLSIVAVKGTRAFQMMSYESYMGKVLWMLVTIDEFYLSMLSPSILKEAFSGVCLGVELRFVEVFWSELFWKSRRGDDRSAPAHEDTAMRKLVLRHSRQV